MRYQTPTVVCADGPCPTAALVVNMFRLLFVHNINHNVCVVALKLESFEFPQSFALVFCLTTRLYTCLCLPCQRPCNSHRTRLTSQTTTPRSEV